MLRLIALLIKFLKIERSSELVGTPKTHFLERKRLLKAILR